MLMLGKIQQWIFNALLHRIISALPLSINCVCMFVVDLVLVKCVAMITPDIMSKSCCIQTVLSWVFWSPNKQRCFRTWFCDEFLCLYCIYNLSAQVELLSVHEVHIINNIDFGTATVSMLLSLTVTTASCFCWCYEKSSTVNSF